MNKIKASVFSRIVSIFLLSYKQYIFKLNMLKYLKYQFELNKLLLLEFDLCWLIQLSVMFTIGLQILALFIVINFLQLLIFVRMLPFSLSSIMLNLYAGNETSSGQVQATLKFVGWGIIMLQKYEFSIDQCQIASFQSIIYILQLLSIMVMIHSMTIWTQHKVQLPLKFNQMQSMSCSK